MIGGDSIGERKPGRPTTDPKNIRLEVQLTEEHRERLDYCVDVTSLSRAEIIRQGIDVMHEKITNAQQKK
jgi:hypothetical protein